MKDTSLADFVALVSLLIAIVSGSINVSQHGEIKRLTAENQILETHLQGFKEGTIYGR
jgi:hypothetical protein